MRFLLSGIFFSRESYQTYLILLDMSSNYFIIDHQLLVNKFRGEDKDVCVTFFERLQTQKIDAGYNVVDYRVM